MKNVMTKAWEIARKGAAKFGGSVKSYFAQSLKMAWAMAKKQVNPFADFAKLVETKANDQDVYEFAFKPMTMEKADEFALRLSAEMKSYVVYFVNFFANGQTKFVAKSIEAMDSGRIGGVRVI